MITQSIDIKTPDGVCDSYIAYPGDSTYPAVILYMDAFGPRKYLYEMAQKLATHGYYVLLPNSFYRTRRAPVVDAKFPIKPENMPDAHKMIMPLFQTFKPEFAMRDAGVFLDFLSKQKNVASGKIGTTGYCLGGGLAIRTAAQYPDRIGAAASFHGGNLATDTADSPHRLLNKIKARLYVAIADNDKSMPPEQIERFKVAVNESGVHCKTELYSGAQHGFTMADLPAYNETALNRHWTNLINLFDSTLGKNALGKDA